MFLSAESGEDAASGVAEESAAASGKV